MAEFLVDCPPSPCRMFPNEDLVRVKDLRPIFECLRSVDLRLNELHVATQTPHIREVASELYQEQYRELDALRSECVVALKILRDKGIVTREEMAALR